MKCARTASAKHHVDRCGLAALAAALLTAPVAAMAGAVPMCELIKPAEVLAMAPFQIPLVKTESWPLTSSPGGCRYVFKSDDNQAAVSIGVTDFSTKENAAAAFNNTANDYKNLYGVERPTLQGLGDQSSFAGEDSTGLKLTRGGLVADINMGGMYPEVTMEMKKQASIALATLLLKRMDQLKLK